MADKGTNASPNPSPLETQHPNPFGTSHLIPFHTLTHQNPPKFLTLTLLARDTFLH